MVVGDIADLPRLRHTMKSNGVDAVIHTAALKHVDVCERNPSLAISSILNGTENVLKAVESLDNQINWLLSISSDKACQRSQTYGMCKYLSEQLVKEYTRDEILPSRIFAWACSLRFGNLLGSSGSVVPIWRQRIARGEDLVLRLFNGKPATRLVMLPSTAAQYVCETLETEDPSIKRKIMRGAVLCPSRLYRIDMRTLAETLIEISGARGRVNILTSKALPGESDDEVMFSTTESKQIETIHLANLKMFGIDSKFISKPTQLEIETLDSTTAKEFIRDAIKEMA